MGGPQVATQDDASHCKFSNAELSHLVDVLVLYFESRIMYQRELPSPSNRAVSGHREGSFSQTGFV